MEPWVTIVLTGAAIAGYGWLLPQASSKRQEEPKFQSEEAYDRLLEDLETENRELVDAVAKFKQEQDETVHRLGRRIRELEVQMNEWSGRGPASAKQSISEADRGQSFAAEPVRTIEPLASEPLRPVSALPQAPNPVNEASASLQLPPHEQSAEFAAAELPETPLSIRSRYAELIALHDRGRSVEQIARSLGMNKGEVQLILQLAKREEERHA